MAYRLIYGLGPATNLSDTYPWGFWISFDILAGIALAAPGLTVGTVVYLVWGKGIINTLPVLLFFQVFLDIYLLFLRLLCLTLVGIIEFFMLLDGHGD